MFRQYVVVPATFGVIFFENRVHHGMEDGFFFVRKDFQIFFGSDGHEWTWSIVSADQCPIKCLRCPLLKWSVSFDPFFARWAFSVPINQHSAVAPGVKMDRERVKEPSDPWPPHCKQTHFLPFFMPVHLTYVILNMYRLWRNGFPKPFGQSGRVFHLGCSLGQAADTSERVI